MTDRNDPPVSLNATVPRTTSSRNCRVSIRSVPFVYRRSTTLASDPPYTRARSTVEATVDATVDSSTFFFLPPRLFSLVHPPRRRTSSITIPHTVAASPAATLAAPTPATPPKVPMPSGDAQLTRSNDPTPCASPSVAAYATNDAADCAMNGATCDISGLCCLRRIKLSDQVVGSSVRTDQVRPCARARREPRANHRRYLGDSYVPYMALDGRRR